MLEPSSETVTTNENNSVIDPPTSGSPKPKLPRRKEKAVSRKGLKLRKPGTVTAMPRKSAALLRLKIDRKQLEQCPKISSLLPAQINTTIKAVEVMRFSPEPVIQRFLNTFDAIPAGDRETLSIEAIIVKSTVNPNELLGALLIAFQSTQAQKSALKLMSKHPDLVDASIRYAELPSGVQDRRMMHEAVRFIPTSNGQTFNFNLPSNGPPPPAPLPPPPPEKHESLDVATEADINEVFPVITGPQNRWQENKRLLLKDEN
jgi:hypothetical protein